MLKCDPDIADKTLYVCAYCRPILNNNKIPNRCILNRLITEPVPDELMKLNALERQLIQKASLSNCSKTRAIYWQGSCI